MEKNNKARFLNISIYVIFFVIAFGITCYSSSLVHLTDCPDYDSYAYRYMGMLMAKGGVPYRDAFDNKGPIMYLINWIGYVINKEYGIYFVELIFVYGFILTQYKFSLKFSSKINSVIFVIASITSLSVFFVGNWTEEYSLLFYAVGINIFIDYLIFDKDDWYRIVLCGVSCCCAFFLRPNMISLWIVFAIAIIIRYIKKYKKFPIKISIWFSVGVGAVLLPTLIWLGCAGALNEFWKDFVLSNITYATDHAVVTGRWKVFFDFFISSNMELHIILLIYMIIKKKNAFTNISYIAYMLLNLYLISMKGVLFNNYAMTIVPSLLYPICSFDLYIVKYWKLTTQKLYVSLCGLMSIMLIVFLFNNFTQLIDKMMMGNPYEIEDDFIVSQINEYTDPDDRILVLGYKCFYYVASDRLSSTIFYYSTNNYGYPDGHQAVVDAVNENLPKLIVVEGGEDPEDLFQHYDQYEMIDNNPMLWILKE